jgi:hypothetical protein
LNGAQGLNGMNDWNGFEQSYLFGGM